MEEAFFLDVKDIQEYKENPPDSMDSN